MMSRICKLFAIFSSFLGFGWVILGLSWVFLQALQVWLRSTKKGICAVEELSAVGQLFEDEKYPYLCDAASIQYIQECDVVFILRGVHGSGTSRLAEMLVNLYPNAKLYTDGQSDGSDQLLQTQEEHSGTIIIVDRHNINRSDVLPYLRKYESFMHILVEPQPPWRNQADELALRCKHGLTQEEIQKQLDEFQTFRPSYYAWFLKEADADDLRGTAIETLRSCAQTRFQPLAELLDNYQSNNFFDDVSNRMLHCTAKFLGRDKNSPFHANVLLSAAIGKKFRLHVSGFFFSHKAIFAIIDLYKSVDSNLMLKLFNSSEEESARQRHPGKTDEGNPNGHQSTLRQGCSAHITIAFQKGLQAKVSGTELLAVFEEFVEKTEKNIAQVTTEIGLLESFGESRYILTLKKPLELDSLFLGFYPRY